MKTIRQTTQLPLTPVVPMAPTYTSEAVVRAGILAIREQYRSRRTSHVARAELEAALAADELSLVRQAKLPDGDFDRRLEMWIQGRLDDLRKRNLLMTDQQLADWRIGRKWTVGDRARYIGQTRQEPINATTLVARPHGQTGTIISAVRSRVEPRKEVTEVECASVTFRPDAPVDDHLVTLEFREHTPGWLNVERIP